MEGRSIQWTNVTEQLQTQGGTATHLVPVYTNHRIHGLESRIPAHQLTIFTSCWNFHPKHANPPTRTPTTIPTPQRHNPPPHHGLAAISPPGDPFIVRLPWSPAHDPHDLRREVRQGPHPVREGGPARPPRGGITPPPAPKAPVGEKNSHPAPLMLEKNREQKNLVKSRVVYSTFWGNLDVILQLFIFSLV